MTESEYRVKLSNLIKEFEVKKSELGMQYASANKKFSKNDIIKHINSGVIIQVQRIVFVPFSIGSSIPSVKYIGIELDKKLKPKKSNKDAEIHQDNTELVKKA